MSKVKFFFDNSVTMRQFDSALIYLSIDYEVDDSPGNFYPYYRLRFGEIMMVAQTNWDRHVVCLFPVGNLSDEHQHISEKLATLFDTTITVEDGSTGSAAPQWLREIVAKQREDTAERWGFR
jgi:hypothetical protein